MVHFTVDGNPDDITLPMIGGSSFPTRVYESMEEPFRCIIKLGTPGNINGFDVDTSHFNGAPVTSRRAENVANKKCRK